MTADMAEELACQYGNRLRGLPWVRWVGEVGWVVLGQVATVLGSLVGLKVLTQLLPKEIFGQVNLLMVAMVLPGWVLFAPFSQAAIRMYAPSREAGNLAPLLRTSILVHALGSGLVLAVGLPLASSRLFGMTDISTLSLVLAIAVFLGDMWQALGVGISGAARLRARVAGVSTIGTWARPLCAGLIVIAMGPSVESTLAGFAIASLVTLPLGLKPAIGEAVQGRGRWLDAEILGRMVAYGAPFGVWSTLSWGRNYVDRYVLQLTLGAGAVGAYAAAFQVAGLPFNLGLALLGQIITPVVFERAGAGVDPVRLASAGSLVRLAVWIFAALGLVAVLVYGLAGSWLMSFLTGKEYVVSDGILAVLAAGALAQNTGQLLTARVLAQNCSRLLIRAFLIPGILSVPLSWLLVTRHGILGAALANATTSCVFLVIVWTLLRRLNRENTTRAGIRGA